jgi:hypothetical protein
MNESMSLDLGQLKIVNLSLVGVDLQHISSESAAIAFPPSLQTICVDNMNAASRVLEALFLNRKTLPSIPLKGPAAFTDAEVDLLATSLWAVKTLKLNFISTRLSERHIKALFLEIRRSSIENIEIKGHSWQALSSADISLGFPLSLRTVKLSTAPPFIFEALFSTARNLSLVSLKCAAGFKFRSAEQSKASRLAENGSEMVSATSFGKQYASDRSDI